MQRNFTRGHTQSHGKLVFFGGMLLGWTSGVTLAVYHWMPQLCTQFLQTAEPLELFWRMAMVSGCCLLCCLLSGFSAIGQPAAWLGLLLYSMLCGGSLLLRMQTGEGIFSLLRELPWLLPGTVGTSLLVTMAAREAVRFSHFSFAYVVQNQWEDGMPHEYRLYCVRCGVLLGLLAGLLCICRGILYLMQSLGS